jgi:HTH-type transcriptional regulator/antitoxin HigA
MLISADAWEQTRSSLLPKPAKRIVRQIAEELRISPAIVAGRVRYETGNYKQLGSLVGAYQVREQFEEYSVDGGQ